jgi:hypothetical protein
MGLIAVLMSFSLATASWGIDTCTAPGQLLWLWCLCLVFGVAHDHMRGRIYGQIYMKSKWTSSAKCIGIGL